MKRNILYILGMACLMTACLDEPFVNYEPTPGVEVQFSGNLNQTQTRTLYGQESGNKVPVHWVHGDTISVYGTTCLSGRKQADYTVNTIDPNGTTGQPEAGNDFAFSLDKVGAYGVQWGEQSTSDFYAIYPSTKGTFSEVDGEVTVTTNIRSAQKNRFVQKVVGKKVNFPEVDSIVWEGVPYINDLNNPTMRDALMYAYTPNANSTAQVDLKFHPFSTVLKFHIKGWTGEGIETGLEAAVNRIVLKAPEGVGIAGDCTFTFNDGEPTASNGTSNTITVYPDYLPMGEQEAIEFHVFAIPHTNQMALNENWTVTIETSNFGNHTFKLKPKEGTNATLLPSKIHKINVPLKSVDMMSEVELPKDTWMQYIPRNVYLSELSVPGSWYSNDSNYQGANNTIANQFSKGVRAFHFDCRLNMPSKQGYTDNDANNAKLVLAHSGTDKCGTLESYNSGTLIESLMTQVATLAESVKGKEYVVVILTVAENHLENRGITSTSVYGTVKPSLVLPRIYSMLNANKDKWNLYYRKNINDEDYEYGISANTTINDVLTNGNLIVIINANTTPTAFSSYDYGSNFTFAGLISQASLAPSSVDGCEKGNFGIMNTSDLYWGNTQASLSHYYHFAQRTLSSSSIDYNNFPRFKTRMTAIDDIISKSEEIYKTSKHNAWFQIGIGGYQRDRIDHWYGDTDGDESHEEVAKQLNPYLLNWINKKLAKEDNLSPSPVGVVLMNYSSSETEYTSTESGQTYTGSSKDLINAIIKLNTQFTLERNFDELEWPDGKNPYEDLFNQIQPSQNAAYAEVGEDVF